jgi:DNA-binding CsgD family transcriptional regulator
VLLIAHPVERVRAVLAMAAVDAGSTIVLAPDVRRACDAAATNEITAAIVAASLPNGDAQAIASLLEQSSPAVPTLLLLPGAPAAPALFNRAALWLVEPPDIGLVWAWLEAVSERRIDCAARRLARERSLSARETAVLASHAIRAARPSLAADLGVQDGTIGTYRRRIEAKFDEPIDAVAKEVIRRAGTRPPRPRL